VGSMAQLMDPAGWWALVSSGWNDIGHTEFWIALAKIMWINILLSGDNAVVIAMACRGLPHRQRVWGMILGAGVAVGLRIIFTGVVASLMLLPYLKIVGGLALFYIAAKLLVPEDPDESEAEAAEHLWRAVRIVAIADIIMSLDNVIAIAAAAGGTYHGLMERMNPVTSHAIWKVTLYGVGVATLLMLSATVLAYLPAPWKLIFLAITFIQFVLYIYVISGSNDFRYVIYNYLPAMIAILCMAGYHRNLWLVGAVLISFAGAAVQRSGIVLHKHLNFNDLYHFIQMVGMYFFYRGGRLL